MADLTAKDIEFLRGIATATIARGRVCASYVEVAAAMNRRPARHYSLSIARKYRSICHRFPGKSPGEVDMYVGRIAPRDRWSNSAIFLTDAGRAALAVAEERILELGENQDESN